MAGACRGLSAEFVETVPQKGVIKGYMQSEGRFIALVEGGKTVRVNDVFTVTRDGYKTTWKVLELSARKKRFAKGPSVAIDSGKTEDDRATASGEPAPNYDRILLLMEKYAREYRESDSAARKEKLLNLARKQAERWCDKYRMLCVKGELDGIAMAGESVARVTLKNVDTGAFNPLNQKYLDISEEYQVEVPLEHGEALKLNTGDVVVITGTPSFRPGLTIVYGKAKEFTRFSMVDDGSRIGSLLWEEREMRVLAGESGEEDE